MTAGLAAAPRTRAPRGTIAEALSGRDNALNFVRLVLASLVILAHTWSLGGFLPALPFDVGFIAVNGFFAISGYLIAGSRVRLSMAGFLWRRALRIFPAFWVCLAVVAFGFAPLAAWLTGAEWQPGSAAGFVGRNLGLWIVQGDIDHTLRDVRILGWSGPLWTLAYEFLAYLAAGALLSVTVVRRYPAVCLSTLLASWLAVELLLLGPGDLALPFWVSALRLGGFFLAGMVLWSVSDRLPVAWWLGVPALVVMTGAGTLTETFNYTLAAVPTAYAMLWLGAWLPTRLGSVNDISYGIYIYGWPVQQTLATTGVAAALGFWGYFGAALALTVPLAALSWFLVERRALALRGLVE